MDDFVPYGSPIPYHRPWINPAGSWQKGGEPPSRSPARRAFALSTWRLHHPRMGTPVRVKHQSLISMRGRIWSKKGLQVDGLKKGKIRMTSMTNENDILFEVMTPLGFRVRVSQAYWKLITEIKHPVMAGREEDVRRALETPDEIRRSKSDEDVYLFYSSEREKRWLCAVSKRTGGDGFLITTYPTDAIKEGIQVWHK